jgi:hypothetical protein
VVHTSNNASRKINEQIRGVSMSYIKKLEIERMNYELLAQCIRSDQLSAAQVQEEFKHNPDFESWYRSKYGL